MTVSHVLKVKIGFTFVLWALPSLLVPPAWFRGVGFPEIRPFMFVRLFGAAACALLVGYILALRDLHDKQGPKDITNTVWVGIVSNGLSFAVLVGYALIGAWAEWGAGARLIMWVSTVMTGLITLGLLWFGVRRRSQVEAEEQR